MTDITDRLRGWCTDWDGTPMVRGEPPLDGIHCDILLDAADLITALRSRVEALQSHIAKLYVERDQAQAALVEALEVVMELARIHRSVRSAVLTAHSLRGQGASAEMVSDDKDLRSDFYLLGDKARAFLTKHGGKK